MAKITIELNTRQQFGFANRYFMQIQIANINKQSSDVSAYATVANFKCNQKYFIEKINMFHLFFFEMFEKHLRGIKMGENMSRAKKND